MVFISKNDNCDAKMIVHASGESQLNHSVSRNNCNLIFLTISCSPSYYTYLRPPREVWQGVRFPSPSAFCAPQRTKINLSASRSDFLSNHVGIVFEYCRYNMAQCVHPVTIHTYIHEGSLTSFLYMYMAKDWILHQCF